VSSAKSERISFVTHQVESIMRYSESRASCSGKVLGQRIGSMRKEISRTSKTDTGYTIPLFPQVTPLLRRLRKDGKIVADRPVFSMRDPKKALAHACKRLKFPHFAPRSLRRCFITRAIEKGVDFKTLASWQGHRDGGVLIAKTYSHLRNDSLISQRVHRIDFRSAMSGFLSAHR